MFFWEEPVFDVETPSLEVRLVQYQLRVVVPHLPAGMAEAQIWKAQESLLQTLLSQYRMEDYGLWYYTPMGIQFTRRLHPRVVIYDCMDELSAFRGAPPGLRAAESELFSKAQLVFTGGRSLYERKRWQHQSVHCFPSSIDREFFKIARRPQPDAEDQAAIPHPRLGYCGVIDERMDTELLAAVAEARPEWQIVMAGPIVKISPSELPQRPNIHYLGAKEYRDLPRYLGGWDVGILPFARNESTRFISPTKTPEYLAAGLPVVSTPIADVIDPYQKADLVEIAATPEEFVVAAERAIASRNCTKRLAQVDQFLSHISWDLTWQRMSSLIDEAYRRKTLRPVAQPATNTAAAAD
ncbi:MAG: glycosyltransferase [Acidobacteriales bacterium]|nr:glycosyltransferase [Terriglobales bacterium]